MLFSCCLYSDAKEIIKGKLYWLSSAETPKKTARSFFFNVDNDLVYEPLSSDFGPLDISKTVKFVQELKSLLKCPQFVDCKIFHHTSLDPAKRANAAFLMGAFQIIALGKNAEEAWEPLSKVKPEFIPFRDASFGSCDYKCTILDCLKGLQYAMQLGWFDINKFDVKVYEQNAKVDVNWIIPGKLLAFSEPADNSKDREGYHRFVPEDYIPTFKKLNVKTIIRLNSQNYDKKRFTQMGFNHFDMDISETLYPTDEQIDNFVQLCHDQRGPIAIHCKTGLAYTGTMIACYAMKVHNFPGASLIGWMRLCRPGSILGKHQHFIVKKEENLCSFLQTMFSVPEVASQDLEHRGESMVQQQPYVFKSPKCSPSQLEKCTVQKAS